MPIKKAAKLATGEVFLPVLTGTATTLMPFIPLAFWNSVIGSFMFFLPVTLIITLVASLLVAYIINPVFAVDFMKPHNATDTGKRRWKKSDKVRMIIFLSVAAVCYITKSWGAGNFILFLYGFVLLEKFVFEKWIHSFQNRAWPAFQGWYVKWLQRALRRPWATVGITMGIFVGTIVLVNLRPPNVVFFPSGDPNFTYVYLNMPVGTDQAYTNTILARVEKQVGEALTDPKTGKLSPIVKKHHRECDRRRR